jgi:hypothetical protein
MILLNFLFIFSGANVYKDDVNLQARALSRKIVVDGIRHFSNAVNAFYSNQGRYGDGLSAQVKMNNGHITLFV